MHTYTNIPYVIAGNCQGQMQTGRYIDFWGDDPPIPASAVQPYDFANIYGKGAPHNKLMVSFLNMMGVPNDGTFGGGLRRELAGPHHRMTLRWRDYAALAG